MSSKHDEFDPTRPALVLLYGSTTKKHRTLDREVLVIGRARGCDLGLEAPDISSVHCIIMRGVAGFSLRDCQSRAGTKLNGNAVRESPLHDGDVLQIGPFSFRAHLPASHRVAPVVPNQSRLHHVEHSRRNLAHIALQQRKLLQLQRAVKAAGDQECEQKEQLGKQASALKARIRDCDQRVRTIEDAERDLSRDRETFEKEQAGFRARVQQSEQDLGRRQQELQEREGRVAPQLQGQVELQGRLEERQRKLEAWAAELQQRGEELQARSAHLSDQQHQVHEVARQQQQKQCDLEAMAHQLQSREQQLEEQAAPQEQQGAKSAEEYQEWTRRWQQLSAKLQAFEQEQKEFAMMKAQRARNQGAILERLAQQKSAMAQAEEMLHLQRHGLDDLIAFVQDASAADDGQHAGELANLRQDNEQLHQLLAKGAQAAGASEEELLKIAKENEDLKRQLDALKLEREHAGASAKHRPVEPGELEALRAQLVEKDAQLERLRHRPAGPPLEHDVADYESELNEFQRQLEADRQKLNAEIDQLRTRNGELDEATREMELEMSRERAELARERQKLERLRDEVRSELERFQRDAGVRERLAPVQNLREELNNRRQPGQDETSRLGKEEAVQAKLRQLRSRITDG
jgi:chromosome segregation ATPase